MKNKNQDDALEILKAEISSAGTVSYIVHEKAMQRNREIINHLIMAIIIISCAFIGFITFDRYQDSYATETIYQAESDADGGNAVITEGDVNIG